MFILNGNRRPAPTFSVEFKKNSKYPIAKLSKAAYYMAVDKFHKAKIFDKEHFVNQINKKQINAFITWNSNKKEFTTNDHIVLVNTVVNKKSRHPQYGVVSHFYILPKNIFVKEPRQLENHFVAELNPKAVIDTQTVNNVTIKMFKVSSGDVTLYVRSKGEADYYYVQYGGEMPTAVNVVEVNNKFFEVVGEIDVTTVDITANMLKISSTGKVKDGVSVEGLIGKKFFNTKVEKLKKGLYQVIGDNFGYIFIETVKSEIDGTTRKVHFLKDGNPVLEKLKEKYAIITAVK